MSERARAYAYRIALPIITLAGIYGLLDERQAAGWIALAAAIFSSSLAIGHTTTKPAEPQPQAGDPGELP